VLIHGRIASLLEVGTGFHPDLTGKDNVYLNGVILGMSRQEVARKYDEIVDFAGVEGFMDTPVKHYSSGMRVRLAFAVAAHLEPEILVIDEVLAVGDQSFQQKCLGKIGEVSRAGRTVLFVSHNAAAVENLCTKGIVLDHGRLAFSGTQTEAIHYYAHSERQNRSVSLRDRKDRLGNGEVIGTAMELRNGAGQPVSTAFSGDPIEIWLYFENFKRQPWPNLVITLTVRTEFDTPVFMQQNRLTGDVFGPLPGRGALVCRIPRLPLAAATYRIGYTIASQKGGGERFDTIVNALEMPVESGDFFGTGELPAIQLGVCLVDAKWRMEGGATAAPASP
jgi:lipopolysaccharide transport system ATP-binding protein